MLSPKLTTLLFALLLGGTLRAQYIQVSTNPSSLLFGVFKLEAEVSLGKNFALEPEAALFVKGQRFWSQDYETEGERFGLVIKKYLDRSKPYEGFYGFMYGRFGNIVYTDFMEEGEMRDQRDFDRQRNTVGFGLGHAKVGKDGFYYGFSLGIGRHFVNEKTYQTPTLAPNGEIYESNDAELIQMPIDVYGRISVGVRLYSPAGRDAKDAYERQQDELEAERREQIQQGLDALELERQQRLQELELRRQQLRSGQ